MLHINAILEALEALGELLAEQDLAFHAIVLGGANLLVSGVIDRPTVDVDVIAERGAAGELLPATPLPDAIADAVAIVARLKGLPLDWFNSVAGSEVQFGVPDGCMARLRPQVFSALTVWWVDRTDIIAFKLVAAVDHRSHPANKHLEDLRLLAPSAPELRHAVTWFERITAPSSAVFTELGHILKEFGYER